MSTTKRVLQGLDEISGWQEELYVHLHQNPELSMQETQTTAQITRRLEAYGYDVQQIGGGVVGILANGEGPTVLFRADIDVALGHHVLAVPWAGEVGTTAGPVLSTGACIRIKVTGKGSHGSMPHLGVDPVLMASAIVTRLQGIVAREIAPGQFGVVTVGSLQSGTKANIIPNDATLLLNIRAYAEAVRDKLQASIERIVRAECQASGAPVEPTFELYDQYPLTDNDPDVNARVTGAFVDHFGAERVKKLEPITASEDFSIIPDAFGVPYCYWGFGGFTVGTPTLPNHNPGFGPVMQPTLRTGTEAAVAAVLAYLGKDEQA